MQPLNRAITELANRVPSLALANILSALRGPDFSMYFYGHMERRRLVFQPILDTGVLRPEWSTTPNPNEEPYNECYLKRLTTARIRAIVCPTYDLWDVVTQPLDWDMRSLRDDLLQRAPEHFQNHYSFAVHAIRSAYNYNLETEEPFNG